MTLVGLSDAQVSDLLSNPDRLRASTSSLGPYLAPSQTGRSAIVTRFDDVAQVLDDAEHFGVAGVYGAAMARTTGEFVLGFDDRVRWDRESKFIHSAVRPEDMARIRRIAAREANDRIAKAQGTGRIDAASGYAHPIALAVVAEYFGVPGPDPRTLGEWLRAVFWDVFLNVPPRADVTEAARRISLDLNAYLDRRIAELCAAFQATGEVPDTFLGRLVMARAEHGMDEYGVRRNIAGVVFGAVDTVSKATVHAIDQVLRMPAALAMATRAAAVDDDDTVAGCAFEALRFNPHNSILIRECLSDVTLAPGTDREATVTRGSKVYVSIASAMFDEHVVVAPREFRATRPWSNYLHFGRGLHRCFGERMAQTLVPQLTKALLRTSGLRRAPEPEGRVRYKGPFPDRLVLELGAKPR
jgi:cytochrome P450